HALGARGREAGHPLKNGHVPVARLPAAPPLLRAAFRNEPRFAGAAVLLAVTMLPTLVAHAFDDRLVGGVPAWTKPLKFQAALVVYLATLAWFAAWLPRGFAA
ncbi:MAG: hypothetical protein ACK58T_02215, partial [Phycisphaerae bacterium]